MRLGKPRIQPLQEDELTAEQRGILNSLGPAARMNAFRTLVRAPKLLQPLVSLLIYILQESTVPLREKELLVLRTAWLCKAEYEWSHHSVSGKQAGLTDQELLRVTKGPDAKGWSLSDATLLRAADELHRDAFISDSTWLSLSERYTEQQLMDIVFTVGLYHIASMTLNSWGVQLDAGLTGFLSQAE